MNCCLGVAMLFMLYILVSNTLDLGYLLTYLQFSVIKWAKGARARKTQLMLSLMKQFRSNCLTLH